MYSICFRRQVLLIREKENLSINAVAKRFGIASRSVVSWLQRLAPKTKRNKPATKIDIEALIQDVSNYPDAYLYERASRLNVSKSCVHSTLNRLQITYKKNSKSSKSGSRKAIYVLPKDRVV